MTSRPRTYRTDVPPSTTTHSTYETKDVTGDETTTHPAYSSVFYGSYPMIITQPHMLGGETKVIIGHWLTYKGAAYAPGDEAFLSYDDAESLVRSGYARYPLTETGC